jgi:hypothetical protein
MALDEMVFGIPFRKAVERAEREREKGCYVVLPPSTETHYLLMITRESSNCEFMNEDQRMERLGEV